MWNECFLTLLNIFDVPLQSLMASEVCDLLVDNFVLQLLLAAYMSV